MNNSYRTRDAVAGARSAPRAGLRAVALGALLALAATGAEAQGTAPSAPSLPGEPGVLSRSAPTKRTFRLFAEEDFAMTGMKMVGTYGFYASNQGPCTLYFTISGESCANLIMPNGTQRRGYFDVSLVAGAGLSDFRKIRSVYPGVNRMLPPVGYSTPWVLLGSTPEVRRWGAADGQFGSLFSGVASTADGSCKDVSGFQNGRVPAGVTLLPMSDCPETWSQNGFQGQVTITDAAFLQLKTANPATFTFDNWKVPVALRDTAMLGSYSTYGLISDFTREIIQMYGEITPLGERGVAPAERGFPIGLEIRMDAFQFARPSIQNAVFFQYTIVNKSDKVWGQGINYDSLYFGVSFGAEFGGAQQGHWYQDPSRGVSVLVGGNTSRNCSTTFPRRFPGAGGCLNTEAFARGAHGMVILKSPIGDLRNKLLADSNSVFYAPTNPSKDDTITFNHVRRGAFGGLYNQSFGRSDRALFGYMSSIEDLFFDGRTINDFAVLPNDILRHFYPEDYNGTATREAAKFNDFVPGDNTVPGRVVQYGGWDYDDDGIQDTLHMPSCGRKGCTGLWTDSLAGNGIVPVFGNQGNMISAGPFKLRANDTTQFIIAFIGAPDSTSFEGLLNATVSTYINNYRGPRPFPAPRFVTATVDPTTGSTGGGGDVIVTPAAVRDSTNADPRAVVRIRVPTPAPYRDEYVQAILNEVAVNPRLNAIRKLNPTLIATLQSRITNNLSEILVFKSCDRGATFTVTADCAPARSVNPLGQNIGFGFRPIARITTSSTGALSTNFFEDIVLPGRTYLYSFVTRTRGLLDLNLVDSIGGRPQPSTLGQAFTRAGLPPIDIDTINSPLARTGPSTVNVYAPISLPAGTQQALFDTIRVQGTATRRFLIASRGTAVRPGTYELFFANRFIVTTQRDTVRGTNTQTVVAQRRIRGGSDATNSNTIVVADERTYQRAGTAEIIVRGLAAGFGTRRSATGAIVTYIDTVTSGTIGYVLSRDTVGGPPEPIFINPDIGATDQSLTAFETSPLFPGFIPSLEPNTASTSTPRFNFVYRERPGGGRDTLNATVVNANGVIYQHAVDASSNPTVSRHLGPGGTYTVRYSDDPFGPRAPFRITTPGTIDTAIYNSLLARRVAYTTVTDTATSALVRAAAGSAFSTRPLVAAKLPFVLRGIDGQELTIAMFRRNPTSADSLTRNSILLGNVTDTVRVSVPADVWVPGDSLYVVESFERDSTVTVSGNVTTILKDTIVQGRNARVPIRVRSARVSFAPLVLGCTIANATPNRRSCNPIALTTLGASGYLPYEDGYVNVIDFIRPFELFTTLAGTVSPLRVAGNTVTAADLARIRVVPNPYIVQSTFDDIQQRVGTPRIRFINVPERGMMRVYTMSGQLVQVVSWTAADLINAGNGTPSGDLPFVLRTREGLEMGSGLYLYVITATGPNGGNQVARGKFVIIR